MIMFVWFGRFSNVIIILEWRRKNILMMIVVLVNGEWWMVMVSIDSTLTHTHNDWLVYSPFWILILFFFWNKINDDNGFENIFISNIFPVLIRMFFFVRLQSIVSIYIVDSTILWLIDRIGWFWRKKNVIIIIIFIIDNNDFLIGNPISPIIIISTDCVQMWIFFRFVLCNITVKFQKKTENVEIIYEKDSIKNSMFKAIIIDR